MRWESEAAGLAAPQGGHNRNVHTHRKVSESIEGFVGTNDSGDVRNGMEYDRAVWRDAKY